MDRRKIKKIPLSPVPDMPDGYAIAVSARLINMGSRILLLDIHFGDGGFMRLAFDRKNGDWGDYSSDSPKWKKRYIRDGWGPYHYIWDDRRITGKEYISKDSQEKISRYFNSGRDWDRAVYDFQRSIRDKEAVKRLKKKQAAIKERHSLLPPLPQGFIKWAERQMPVEYIYYKRDGKYVECSCSACGESYTVNTGGIYRRKDREMPHKMRFIRGDEVKCVKCGTECIAKPVKTCRYGYAKTEYFNIGQKYGTDGFVFRQIELSKMFYIDNKSSFKIREKARLYSDGYMEYYHEGFLSPEHWSATPPMMYYSVWQPKDCPTYPETFENIKGTEWQYSQLKEVDGFEKYRINLWDYLREYDKDRWLEAVVKLKFEWLAYSIITDYYGHMQVNPHASTPYGYLRIYRHRIKDLKEAGSGFPEKESKVRLLKAFQTECALNIHLTLEQCRYIATTGISTESFRVILTYTTFIKAVNYVKKQVPAASGTTLDAIHLYRDYLEMKAETGYDMADEITLYPHNLREAHNRVLDEREKQRADEKKKEKEKEFARIRGRYKKALKAYGYKDDDLIIRPARGAGEIIDEGRKLHHCVGGDSYLEKHNSGKSTILFLRSIKHQRTPYITVEIDPKGRIVQWYGAYDKKPDREKIDGWLKDYVKHLKPKALSEAV